MVGALNYNPGQYFCWNGSLIRVESVNVDDDQNHTVYYDCLVFSYDEEDSNYNCAPLTVSHEFILENFQFVFRNCEDCDND